MTQTRKVIGFRTEDLRLVVDALRDSPAPPTIGERSRLALIYLKLETALEGASGGEVAVELDAGERRAIIDVLIGPMTPWKVIGWLRAVRIAQALGWSDPEAEELLQRLNGGDNA